MNKTKSIFFILFISLILLLITGCSNNEINNMMIVDSIGITKENDTYNISFNTYIGNDKYKVINTKVNNLDLAFEDIYLKVNKKIYLSHLNILYLSSSLDNLDVSEVINTLNNRNDLRGSFLVIMVKDYDEKILDNDSLEIVNLIKNNHNEIGSVYPTSFNDIISNYLDLNISYIPVVDKRLNLIGTHSIFDEYHFYDIDSSKYLNLLHNNLKSMTFNIDNEEIKVSDIKTIYKVNKDNIKIKIFLKYKSNLDKSIIKKDLDNKINSFLELDISSNFFINLIKKYDYDFYKNDNLDIKYEINLFIDKDKVNNIKEDNLIEKD